MYLVIIVKNDGFKIEMAAIFQTIFLISRNDVFRQQIQKVPYYHIDT